jgi:hypothetical protein
LAFHALLGWVYLGMAAGSAAGRKSHMHCCTTVNLGLWLNMIKSFKHIGLQKIFTTGSPAGINADHAPRLELRLQALHTATVITDMDIYH